MKYTNLFLPLLLINSLSTHCMETTHETATKTLVQMMNEPRNWQNIFAYLNAFPFLNVNEHFNQVGYSLLHLAVMDKNYEAVKKLLAEYNANPNLPSSWERTLPLELALFYLKPDMAITYLLLDYGADPGMRVSGEQKTIREKAAERGIILRKPL